jgi:hypothetical protein
LLYFIGHKAELTLPPFLSNWAFSLQSLELTVPSETTFLVRVQSYVKPASFILNGGYRALYFV